MAEAQQAPQQPDVSAGEALMRGAYSGAWQQPRDVVAAGAASLFGGIPFKEALKEAKEASLSGRQGEVKKQRPGYFGGGEIAGNIAMTAMPGLAATKAIGAAAPALSSVPVAGSILSKTAQGIGAAKGLSGVPLSGAIQGGISSLASQGDLSGALPGAIGAGAVGVAGKIAKPISDDVTTAARKGFTKLLEKSDIGLTPAQKTGNRTLELLDSVLQEMPFTATKSRDMSEKQLRKFTAAALKRAGLTGDDISPAIREAAEKSFQSRYGALTSGQSIKIDNDVLSVLSEIETKNLNKLPTNIKPVVESYIDDILNTGGQMSGEAYQAARSQLGQQAKAMSLSDPFTANILRKLRGALDDAAERSLPEAKKGAWRELNRQYANYKLIQKSVSNTSENSLEGLLSPKALLRTIETANKTKGQAGYGDLYNLARAGSGVLADSVPNSGTAQRQLIQGMLTGGGIGLGAGGVTYGITQDPEKAMAAAALSIGAPIAAQKFIQSGIGGQYLTKGLPGASALASKEAKALAAILAAQTGGQ